MKYMTVAKRFGAKVLQKGAMVGAATLGMVSLAHADAEALGAAALAEVGGISDGVDPILIALIVVVFAILAFVYFRKAAK